jgi:hypothetical protein
MRLSIRFFLLTLVLQASAAVAAPIIRHEIEPIDTSPKLEQPKISAQPGSNIIPNYDTSFRVGIISGVFDESREQRIRQFAALRFDFNKKSFETWQAEIKIGTNNFIHANVGRKTPFVLEEVTAPYYRFAVGNLLDSSEGIGSILNFKKFQAIAAIGMDDLFLLNHRLQAEFSAGATLIGAQVECSLGYAF